MADTELRFANIDWNIAEVMECYPELTEEQVFDILVDKEEAIASAMIMAGWAAIHDAIPKELINDECENEEEGVDPSGGSEPERDPASSSESDRCDNDSCERCGCKVPGG